MGNPAKKLTPEVSVEIKPRPLLKWAGGKTQLLPQLRERMPSKFNRYIEPFIGGGAFFFSLEPEDAVIADSNPELVNLYQSVADNVEGVIEHLYHYTNDKDLFYEVRAQKWESLEAEHAAARTVFLNHTCFNGLYQARSC